MVLRLNLGCGRDILDGYINIDFFSGDGVNMVLDLNECRLPFECGSVDEIKLFHICEHLNEPYRFILECHRVLKKNGVLSVQLPNGNATLQHQRYVHGMDYFKCICDMDINSAGFQTQNLFELVYQKGYFKGFKQIYFKLRNWFLNLFYAGYEYSLRKV